MDVNRARALSHRSGYGRIVHLVVIMVAVVCSVLGLSLFLMYRTAIGEEKARLVETVQSQARLFEAVNDYDTKNLVAQGYTEAEALEVSLGQLRDAHSRYRGFGETGEFTVGKRVGDEIVWLLRHRHADTEIPDPTDWNSGLAEPMRQALLGNSGVIVDRDYRGQIVIAAHEPVNATEPIGIVAKLDLWEVRTPFIVTGVTMLAISFASIALGLFLFFRVSQPIVESIVRSEAKFKNLTEMSSVAVYMTDTDRNFTYVNPQWLMHAGMSEEAALGQGWVQAIHEDDRERVIASWDRMVESNGTWGCEYRFRRQGDGAVIWLYCFVRELIDANGEKYGYVGVNVDISKRKRAEERARNEFSMRLKHEELLIEQSKLAELGNMTRVISHQWKQPLNVIALANDYTGMLVEERNFDIKKLEKNCKAIETQILFMSETIEEFKNFFKPTENEVVFKVGETTARVKDMFRDLFLAGNCEVEIRQSEEYEVLGYVNEFMQVILNLFNNAVEAMVDHHAEQRKVVCEFTSENGLCIMRFSDTGGGIPEDLLPDRIFELDMTTKGKKGTGIGLYISRSIIQDHMHGSLTARNINGGAEFTIQLPLASVRKQMGVSGLKVSKA